MSWFNVVCNRIHNMSFESSKTYISRVISASIYAFLERQRFVNVAVGVLRMDIMEITCETHSF